MNTTGTRKDQGQEHVERAKDAAGSTFEKAKETAGAVADKAKELAGNAAEKVKDVASNVASTVGSTAGNVASGIGQRAESATASVGSGMHTLGEKVREKGPQSGILGSATESVAGALESGGKYLEEKNLSGMAEDLTSLVRRNPIPALLVGVGLGFLLGRIMRA